MSLKEDCMNSEEISEMFAMIDINKTGVIEINDLKAQFKHIMNYYGYNISPGLIETLIDCMSNDGTKFYINKFINK
jgi:Ca2+-binding EF-hand superfamily protein